MIRKTKKGIVLVSIVVVLCSLLLSPPAHAGTLESLYRKASLDRQWVLIYDDNTNNGYFADREVTIERVRNISQINNDSADYVFLGTSAEVKLYVNDGWQDTYVEIKYNEGDNDIQCRYMFFTTAMVEINEEHDNVRYFDCATSPLGNPISSFAVSGDKVYLVDLNKMCSMDDDGTGEDCDNRWDEEISSFTIKNVGGDVDTTFDPLPWELPPPPPPPPVPSFASTTGTHACTWQEGKCVVGDTECQEGFVPDTTRCGDIKDPTVCGTTENLP